MPVLSLDGCDGILCCSGSERALQRPCLRGHRSGGGAGYTHVRRDQMRPPGEKPAGGGTGKGMGGRGANWTPRRGRGTEGRQRCQAGCSLHTGCGEEAVRGGRAAEGCPGGLYHKGGRRGCGWDFRGQSRPAWPRAVPSPSLAQTAAPPACGGRHERECGRGPPAAALALGGPALWRGSCACARTVFPASAPFALQGCGSRGLGARALMQRPQP